MHTLLSWIPARTEEHCKHCAVCQNHAQEMNGKSRFMAVYLSNYFSIVSDTHRPYYFREGGSSIDLVPLQIQLKKYFYNAATKMKNDQPKDEDRLPAATQNLEDCISALNSQRINGCICNTLITLRNNV